MAANSVLQSSISAVGQSLFGSLTAVPTATGTGGTSGVATVTSGATSTPPPSGSSSSTQSVGLSTDEIAGIAVGAASLLCALIGCLTALSQYRRRSARSDRDTVPRPETFHAQGVSSGVYTAPNTGYMDVSSPQAVPRMLHDQGTNEQVWPAYARSS